MIITSLEWLFLIYNAYVIHASQLPTDALLDYQSNFT